MTGAARTPLPSPWDVWRKDAGGGVICAKAQGNREKGCQGAAGWRLDLVDNLDLPGLGLDHVTFFNHVRDREKLHEVIHGCPDPLGTP
jgi:hypothetical protein